MDLQDYVEYEQVIYWSLMIFLKDVLRRKDDIPSENNAWAQYVHLADWLIHLGAIMDIKATLSEEVYLSTVLGNQLTS
jgi:hypothetical protein